MPVFSLTGQPAVHPAPGCCPSPLTEKQGNATESSEVNYNTMMALNNNLLTFSRLDKTAHNVFFIDIHLMTEDIKEDLIRY